MVTPDQVLEHLTSPLKAADGLLQSNINVLPFVRSHPSHRANLEVQVGPEENNRNNRLIKNNEGHKNNAAFFHKQTMNIMYSDLKNYLDT